jgi:hypothetical protein
MIKKISALDLNIELNSIALPNMHNTINFKNLIAHIPLKTLAANPQKLLCENFGIHC